MCRGVKWAAGNADGLGGYFSGWEDTFGVVLGAAWKEMAQQQQRRITGEGGNSSWELVLGCVENRIGIR